MFYHVKELQYNARVSKPDPRFAKLLLEQFGGSHGELNSAMQYFVQAFACKNTHPEIYDMLMDIAAEELGHLEIVGATIQMLLTGVNGELKNTTDETDLTKMLDGRTVNDDYINHALVNPHFFLTSGGGPTLTDSRGIPWNSSTISSMGDLTVDLRCNMASETRSKLVYENLMKFTADVMVKETLRFLMTREIAHFQMFEAALDSINPNFPPGILQGDPKHSNTYFNFSKGEDFKGPWNEGKSAEFQEEWKFIDDPLEYIRTTNGLLEEKIEKTNRTEESVSLKTRALSRERKLEVDKANNSLKGIMAWSTYGKNSNPVKRKMNKDLPQTDQ
jgi:Mn-containing catalase